MVNSQGYEVFKPIRAVYNFYPEGVQPPGQFGQQIPSRFAVRFGIDAGEQFSQFRVGDGFGMLRDMLLQCGGGERLNFGNFISELSDPELQAIQAYDVWKEKKLYGKVSMGVVRSTYIIDENGFIEKAMEKVKPDTNASDILEYLG